MINNDTRVPQTDQGDKQSDGRGHAALDDQWYSLVDVGDGVSYSQDEEDNTGDEYCT